jgi:hypothetical protein
MEPALRKTDVYLITQNVRGLSPEKGEEILTWKFHMSKRNEQKTEKYT